MPVPVESMWNGRSARLVGFKQRGILSIMLFLVIEHFKNADPKPVGERFRRLGRMMPEGVTYQASWVDGPRARCFQVMEAPNAELLNQWMSHWDDLVEFEVIPVVSSHEFWAGVAMD